MVVADCDSVDDWDESGVDCEADSDVEFFVSS